MLPDYYKYINMILMYLTHLRQCMIMSLEYNTCTFIFEQVKETLINYFEF